MRLAHSLAIASDKISADMVEAIEFPQLANKYGVQGVPRSVINEETQIEGALPEPLFVAYALKAAGLLSQEDLNGLMEDAMAEAEVYHEHEGHEEHEGHDH